MAKKSKKSGKVQVRFDQMVEGGGSKVPDGKYVLKVDSYTIEEGREYEYVAMKFEVIWPKEYKGKNLYENFSFSPKALFKLRDFLTALGIKVLKKAATIDFDALVGKIIGASVEEAEYKDKSNKTKTKSEITEFLPVKKEGKGWTIISTDIEDLDDEDEDDDEDVDDDEEESEDEEEEDDEDSDDDDEDSEEEDEDEDEDEEEEETPPPPKKKSSKKAAEPPAKSKKKGKK